jgi:hypothetical protein
MPSSDAFRMVLKTLELSSSALVGMQPTFRHVPPTRRASTRATDFPRAAAFKAAVYPPTPAPTTIISKDLRFMLK